MRLLEQHRANVARDLTEQEKHLAGITQKIEWYRASLAEGTANTGDAKAKRSSQQVLKESSNKHALTH
jgi:hypothetical protein